MRFPAALRALDHRDFRLYWTGQIVSQVGSWMQTLAQSWLVLELTGSPVRLGAVSALQFGPILFLSFLTGAAIDRFPRRALVLGTQMALMLPAFTLAVLVWSRHVQYWHVVVAAGFVGVVNALDMPARQTLVAEMVGRDDLMNAIALNSAVFNSARIVGPAVGGLLIGRYGLPLAFLLNGVSFVAVVAALLAVRPAAAAPPAPAAVGDDLLAGVRYARGSPLVALVLGLVMVVSFSTLNNNVQVPLFARDVLHQEVHGLGFLMSCLGVGATAGAIAIAAVGRGRPPLAALVTPAVVVSSGLLALALVRQFWLAGAILFVMGAAQIVFLTSCNTTVQLAAPAALRGRVMSLYMLVFSGVTPFGAFLIGSVAEAFGVPAACAIGGALGLLGVVALALRLGPRVRAAG